MPNRESGFGRYDIILEPRTLFRKYSCSATPLEHDVTFKRDTVLDAIIIEFKVQDDEEKDLSDTVREALRQIDEKNYQASLIARGIPEGCIRKYGFAFCGKKVLIGCH